MAVIVLGSKSTIFPSALSFWCGAKLVKDNTFRTFMTYIG